MIPTTESVSYRVGHYIQKITKVWASQDILLALHLDFEAARPIVCATDCVNLLNLPPALEDCYGGDPGEGSTRMPCEWDCGELAYLFKKPLALEGVRGIKSVSTQAN